MIGKIDRRFFVSALTTLMVLASLGLLSACQKESSLDLEKSVSEDSSIEVPESGLETGASATREKGNATQGKEEDRGISLQDAVENPDSIFILRNERCYSATTAFVSGQKGGLLIGGEGEVNVPGLQVSEGDSLISTWENESYAALPFLEEGDAEKEVSNILVYDEIDGVDPSSLNLSSKQSAVEEVLLKRGIVYRDFRWTASEPTEFSVGGYMVTKWSEDIIEIKNRYYVPDWSAEKIILPVTKTRDGYFVIETDALCSGDYLINIYTSVSGVDHMFRLTVL